MIIDNIENISKYNTICHSEAENNMRSFASLRMTEAEESHIISEKVMEFLKGLSPDSPVGHYEIDENSYANIDQYVPKHYNKCEFEAHKKYIDIQMVLFGEENLEYTTIDDLEVSEEYDENRDVMFFGNTNDFDTVRLTPFKFVFIYPHEAHKPQIKTTSDLVKKAVVKIKVTD